MSEYEERTGREHSTLWRVALEDGTCVTLRPVREGDQARLRLLAAMLGPDTYWHYFHVGAGYNEIWAERVAAIGEVTEPDVYALVVEVEGALVGVARFSPPHRPDEALAGVSVEFGILLADAWQGRHLGRYILYHLAQEARRYGKRVLTGDVLWENQRMVRLARRVFPGGRVTYVGSGESRLTLDVDGLAPAAELGVECPCPVEAIMAATA